jgi:CheY-like chemotaxis protein
MLARTLGERIVLRLLGDTDAPSVHADPAMIEQVLMNLALNARDAMPDGGTLTMGTEVVELNERQQQQDPEARGGRFVCLTVRDTGCGMDAGTLQRIFEPFFTTKEVGQGTGLGLATVYGIVKQHRGWVDVESAVGQGTTFRIYFPVANGAVEARAPELEPLPIQTGRGAETILVVEDEAVVRGLVRKIFQNCGYRVLEAGSGDQALQLINQTEQRIDLVLTDLVMPGGISGRELGRRLQAREPKLKVIFASGYSQDFTADNFLQPGINFLSKPYSPPALMQMVRSCLDREPRRDAGATIETQPGREASSPLAAVSTCIAESVAVL